MKDDVREITATLCKYLEMLSGRISTNKQKAQGKKIWEVTLYKRNNNSTLQYRLSGREVE